MTIANAFWIPTLAVTASALIEGLTVTPAINDLDANYEFVPELASLAVPTQSAVSPDEAVGATAQEHAIPDAAGSADIWERLRAEFVLDGQDREAVQAQVATFQTHAWHFRQILKRSEPYLFHVLSRVEARGLPAELALLPVIESAFDPFARSPAGAAGIWQFMPHTAREVGLHLDWWFDGRRDIVAATEAALDYLGALQRRYDGDWLLALAAYNAGSARVNRAIRSNRRQGKPADFWHLSLPAETRNYVPKLLAVSALIADPAAYGIALPSLANDHYFVSVDTGGPLDLQVAARLSGTTLDELQRLNPGFTRSVTPPGSSHRLLVPRAVAERFRERLAQLPDEARVQSVRYRIRPGDTLSAIALNSRTTVTHLRKLNQLEDSHIVAGRQLIVPLTVREEEVSAALSGALANG
jgi:membrane-bound lytic murein transglycosylase D